VAVSNMLLQLVAKLQHDPSVVHGRKILLDYTRKSSGARLALLFLFHKQRRALVLVERSGHSPRHSFPGKDAPVMGQRSSGRIRRMHANRSASHKLLLAQERAERIEVPLNGLFGSALRIPGLQYIPDMYGDPRTLEEEMYWIWRDGPGIVTAVGMGRTAVDARGVLVLSFGPEQAAIDMQTLEEGDLLICISLLSTYLTASNEKDALEEESTSIHDVEYQQPEEEQPGISAHAAEIQTAIDQERSRIARDLHDGIAQNIAHVIHKLELVRRIYERQPQTAQRELSRARDVLIDTLKDLRHGISSLLPVQLEEQGFAKAIRELLQEFRQNEATIKVDYEIENLDIPPSLEVPVYRLIQEALNNVRKHANATHVTIRIRALTGLLIVQVSDNGAGFSAEQVTEGSTRKPAIGHSRKDLHARPTTVTFGLKTMRERVRQAGGILEVASKPGRGTTVKARFPLGESSRILTRREREVLQLLVEGATNRAIAQKLSVSIETVKSHVHHIMQKMQVKDRTQAAVVATRQRWL
jgi:signal transduction histidine kinase/DNA-binding CsgD family transcriptional regulator